MPIRLTGPKNCGKLFLDSGAHSLYGEKIADNKDPDRFKFFRTKGFRKYCDDYAAFLKKYAKGIDLYVNVDVIFDPKLSWKVLKYLENEHGLHPIPVIHYNTPLRWVYKHLDEGYSYIGLGGIGQEATKWDYYSWADRVFDIICPRPSRLPVVRTHGFAMTSFDLLLRYPWYSVDSSSWCKGAGYGFIFIPHKRNNKFVWNEEPYRLFMSWSSRAEELYQDRHYINLSKNEKRTVREWLEVVDVPFGKVDDDGNSVKYGVCSEYNARAVANLRFFEIWMKNLPKWPWPLNITVQHGIFEDL